MNAAITCTGLSKHYQLYGKPADRLKQMLRPARQYFREHHALHDVSLTIQKGETVGLVGCNGSGKSTLLQLIAGILTPSDGSLVVDGRISALLELGAGFNPDFTGHENIYLNASVLGLSHQEIKANYASIIEFSGLSTDIIQQPIRTYSSGMIVRLAFAIAVATDPDILIVDEALAVGDEAFQRKCFARIRDLQTHGKTILFVSHAARMVTDLCDRAIWLHQGETVLDGTPKDVMAAYHKFSYAPSDLQTELLATYRRGEEPAEENVSSLHDPAMLPETRISYAEKGAKITDVFLKDQAGKKVNIIRSGDTVSLHYTVLASADAEEARLGFQIKTIQGQDLGGSSVPLEEIHKSPAIKNGDEIHITFQLDMHLREGTFFVNCGCSGVVDGQRTFLHRIHDAIMFKVLPREGIRANGLVDLNPKASISIAAEKAEK